MNIVWVIEVFMCLTSIGVDSSYLLFSVFGWITIHLTHLGDSVFKTRLTGVRCWVLFLYIGKYMCRLMGIRYIYICILKWMGISCFITLIFVSFKWLSCDLIVWIWCEQLWLVHVDLGDYTNKRGYRFQCKLLLRILSIGCVVVLKAW